jgi:signal transduction histidine kinase
MGDADRRQYWPAVVILVVGLLWAGVQLSLFPVTGTLTVVFLGELSFLAVLGGSIVYVTGIRRSLPRAVSKPLLFGLGVLFVWSVTDLLDEVLTHPTIVSFLFEEVTIIVGTLAIVLGISRWADTRRERERMLVERERRLEAQRNELERQAERLDSFAGVVSHDLRNPIDVAKGYIEIMQTDDNTDHLDTVEDALTRMAEIIDDALALARLGPAAIEPSSVSLAETVADAWDGVETGDATLDVRIPADTTVEADETHLRQLFENVYRNAVEHAGTEPTVTVGPLSDGFYVEDDGPGIPTEHRADVFEMGYTTVQDGTGFGLSIIQRIAESHGWQLSLADDGGARFEIRNVVVGSEETVADAGDATPSPGSTPLDSERDSRADGGR